jgi:hypothetical protein
MALQRTGDRGIRKVSVPDLSGMTRTQYQAALTAVGLTYSESSTTTGDSGLDQKVISQGTTAGTVVNIGSTVSVNYYQYVYSGFSHYAAFGHYAGFYHGFYHGFAHYAGFYHGFYHSFAHYAGFYHGFYHSFAHYSSFAHYAGFYHSFSHTYGSFWTVSANGIYPGYGGFVSLGATTGVHTVDGIKQASEIQVGDVLYSLNISNLDPTVQGIPDFNVPEEQFEALGIVETNVVGVSSYVTDSAIVINGDIFTAPHLILAKDSNGSVSFVRSENITEDYQVWSLDSRDWIPVTSVETIAYIEQVYTINCEPYDIFFTQNMLTHDSISWLTDNEGNAILDADGNPIYPNGTGN